MEGSRRTATRIGHLTSSTKNKQKKKKKRYNLMTESLLFKNTSTCFKFIMTPTRVKTRGLRRKNGTITLRSGKSRTVDNMLLQPVSSET